MSIDSDEAMKVIASNQKHNNNTKDGQHPVEVKHKMGERALDYWPILAAAPSPLATVGKKCLRMRIAPGGKQLWPLQN